MLNKYLKYVNKLKQLGGASYSLSENKLLDIFDRCAENGFINEIKPYINLNKTFRNYNSIWSYFKDEHNNLRNKTRLMYSSRVGDLQRVRFLLNLHANVNLESRYLNNIKKEVLIHEPDGIYFQYNSTALIEACQFNHLDIVQELCNHGAIVNPPIPDLNPFVINPYASGRLLEVWRCSIEYNYSPLVIASANGFIEIVRYLITRGADINFISKGFITEKKNGNVTREIVYHNKYTPLMLACKFSKYDVVRELVERGANINYRTDIFGHPLSALSVAREELRLIYRSNEPDPGILTYLSEHGAE
jgi:ankyrin repeat protein